MNENECYNANLMPLSNDKGLKKAQEKIINGEELSTKEKLILGRDHPVKRIDNYFLKPNCVYRVVSKEHYNQYLKWGYIYGNDENDEYIEYEKDGQIYNNNRGVDWYLGGASLRYGNRGEVIIECPALKQYFTPAFDNGCHLSFDPSVRHMKSSGFKNPVPVSIIKVIKYENDIVSIVFENVLKFLKH